MTQLTPESEPERTPILSAAEREQLDSWISERLDLPPATWTATDFTEFEQASPRLRKRVASLQWLHGLMLQIQQREGRSPADLISRTLQVLPHEPGEPQSNPVPQRVTRRAGSWRRLLVAAVVVLCVGLVWQISNSPSTAYAAVEQALLVAGQHRERQFTVVAELHNSTDQDQRIVSQLFLNGHRQFALDHPALIPGGRLWIGFNGHEYWAVPHVGPVLLSREDGPVTEWLNQFQVSTPYLQLTTVLTRLRDRYTLEDALPESLSSTTADATLQNFRHIRGTLRDATVPLAAQQGTVLPIQIDLWVQPGTGEVRRLVLEWPAARAGSVHNLQRVSFDLTSFTHHPANWYEPQGHHRPHRRVLQHPRIRE